MSTVDSNISAKQKEPAETSFIIVIREQLF